MSRSNGPMQNKLVQFLLDHNRAQSALFSSREAKLERMIYRMDHPTEIGADKCMDGRLLLPAITETPMGIIQPYRNIGARFDIGWPYFGKLMLEWVQYAKSKTRDCLMLTTYHFSQSERELGCRGFDYDTDKAREAAEKLRMQYASVFGKQLIYPIVIGIETDEDAITFHGMNEDVLDLAKEGQTSAADLLAKLLRLYQDMREQMANDLLRLAVGNIHHIAEVRASNRPLGDKEHKEQVLGVGRGFPWLHIQNQALLVGPFSYDLPDPVIKAAGILVDNLKNGRIPEKEGVVLMASAAYRVDTEAERILAPYRQGEIGIEQRLAIEKAQSLASFVYDTIRSKVPSLIDRMAVIAGTVNMENLLFEQVPLPFEV